jgi:hypothetical protein
MQAMLVCYEFILAGESSWVLRGVALGAFPFVESQSLCLQSFRSCPQAAKADFGGRAHRSGKPLRHPKATGRSEGRFDIRYMFILRAELRQSPPESWVMVHWEFRRV